MRLFGVPKLADASTNLHVAAATAFSSQLCLRAESDKFYPHFLPHGV